MRRAYFFVVFVSVAIVTRVKARAWSRRLGACVLVFAQCATPDTEVLGPPPSPLTSPLSCAEARSRLSSLDDDVPTLPVGADAFRDWATTWPIMRIGTRAYMRSTYERSGTNYDSAHFIRKTIGSQGEDHYVGLDVAGSGVLSFLRTNHWHGSPWHYGVDGTNTTASESSTADPNHAVPSSTWIPSNVFAPPLAETWPTTKGADLSWVPIPFSSALTIAYERTHYGTGYWIYSLYPEGASNLSQTPCTWERNPPDPGELTPFTKTAEDVANDLKSSPDMTLLTGSAHSLRIENHGPTTIRALSFDVAKTDAAAFGSATLRMTWDDRPNASIESPIALFFGTGSLFNRNAQEYLVKAFPVSVHDANNRVRFTTILPMPFSRSATIEVVNADAITSMTYAVTFAATPVALKPNWLGYLHATYHDFPNPVPGHDNMLLDTTVDEGGGDWCGSFIGTSFVFSERGDLGTLEGDPRFFFDDSGTPQGQGTGTEEWGGGGDYWENGQPMTLPFVGHPVGVPGGATPINADDSIESAYRFLLSDVMPFGKNARIRLEHGGVDESIEHYRSVTYWYGLPGACLVLADTLHVGDVVDEANHAVTTAGSSELTSLASRYEEGVDHDANGVETYPETSDSGRTIERRMTFRMRIPANNLGVMLRRKLDYALGDQRAIVSVADDRDGAEFVRAGVWYLAGSTSIVLADSADEIGKGADAVLVSPHRWRDDEFLLPRALTSGRSSIRIRIDVVPQTETLLPSTNVAATGFSAYRYSAYAYRLPDAP